MFLRTLWRVRHRRAGTGSQASLSRLGMMLGVLLWPGSVLAFGSSGSDPDLQLGLTAGVAAACALTCAVLWGYMRQALYGAGVAFLLIEGLFRSLPPLLPPGALQAASFAALLALTAPLLSGTPMANRLAAACRWTSIALASVTALALIFVYEAGNGLIPAIIAGVCAIISVPLAAWFIAQSVSRASHRLPALALAAAYVASVWMLGRDAWLSSGGDTSGTLIELARLLLVTGALLGLALGRPLRAPPATHRGVQQQSDAEHLMQGDLRLAELTGALDTQRQMNALISHELRAPLATISAAAQSLDMILSDSGETVDNRLARIHRSVHRMTELMDQLLNQDRLGEPAWTPRGEQMDMAELAREVVNAMKPDTAHALMIHAEGVLPVYCDRPLTSVVVRNLIHNAVKYSPANEPVRIETGQTVVDGVPMAWLAVVDRGPGIGEEEQARIFEPHFRRAAHRETQGMGIGLYLARRICQNQGGTLTMHSTIGVGTRFIVTLPAQRPAS